MKKIILLFLVLIPSLLMAQRYVVRGDSATVPGYLTREQARLDSTNRNALLALKVAQGDTVGTGAKYVTTEQMRVDSVNRNALIALKASLAGDIQWTTLLKSADTTKTATNTGTEAWADIGDLQFMMTLSKNYEIEGCIFTSSATATTGVDIALNAESGPVYSFVSSTIASATTWSFKPLTTNVDSLAQTHAGVNGQVFPQTFKGIVVVDGSNRQFKLRWRKEMVTSTDAQIIKKGSWVKYRIIN